MHTLKQYIYTYVLADKYSILVIQELCESINLFMFPLFLFHHSGFKKNAQLPCCIDYQLQNNRFVLIMNCTITVLY